MSNEKFDKLMGGPPRIPEEWLTQRHMDIAASIQAVTEGGWQTSSTAWSQAPARVTFVSPAACSQLRGERQGLRSGKIDRSTSFGFSPAAGDVSGALWRLRPIILISISGGLLGPELVEEEIEDRLRAAGARYHVLGEKVMQSA
jgi:carbamoyltransferase